MAAKKKPFKPGFIHWTKADYKIISWCINNGIACCVVKAQGFQAPKQDFCIEIVIKKSSNFSPNFEKVEVLHKQMEYYRYYYNKYKTSTN